MGSKPGTGKDGCLVIIVGNNFGKLQPATAKQSRIQRQIRTSNEQAYLSTKINTQKGNKKPPTVISLLHYKLSKRLSILA